MPASFSERAKSFALSLLLQKIIHKYGFSISIKFKVFSTLAAPLVGIKKNSMFFLFCFYCRQLHILDDLNIYLKMVVTVVEL